MHRNSYLMRHRHQRVVVHRKVKVQALEVEDFAVVASDLPPEDFEASLLAATDGGEGGGSTGY
jgi:hypothetical protein